MARTFEDSEAVRQRVPLLIGLMGPSGGGKTFSALRLATGIQRVTGGDIFVIDTEAKRALHYADRFRFRHLPFGAPFGPLDYLEAVEHCVQRGAKIIITDSTSHEHEGPGGVLEQHDRVVAEKGDKYSMTAWIRPKADRRRLINSVLQLPISSIWCFRAKEKVKVVKGQDPKPLGYMPIAGEEFIYEMTVNCLLLPRADGVPTWQSDELGERQMIKLPAQFREIFAKGGPLSEEIGAELAKWAEGAIKWSELGASLLAEVEKASDLTDGSPTHKRLTEARPKLSRPEVLALATAMTGRKAVLTLEQPKTEQTTETQERQPGEDDE